MKTCVALLAALFPLVAVSSPLTSSPVLKRFLCSSVLRNLARGSALRCLADLSGGLPLEVWKSSVVLEHIRASQRANRPAGDVEVLRRIVDERGVGGLWSGCAARMAEGILSGAVLLAAKESLHVALEATPVASSSMSSATIGFVSGAWGGVAQATVMAPCSLIVTATTARGGSVFAAVRDVWERHGVVGMYRGYPAVAMRQATNWASRQGFTELLRPKIKVTGLLGEVMAGCLGGTLSAWNTPFEVARIESQSHAIGLCCVSGVACGSNGEHDRPEKCSGRNLFSTLGGIVEERGVGGLYTGLLPRIGQACYQTVFMVCIPRVLDAR